MYQNIVYSIATVKNDNVKSVKKLAALSALAVVILTSDSPQTNAKEPYSFRFLATYSTY
jgi:hypothetical protein